MKKITSSAQQDSVTLWLLVAVSFLLGIVIGFLFSPIKKGMSIGNNNTSIGSGIGCNCPPDDEDDDYDEDEEIAF